MENQTIKLERFKQAVFEDAEKQAKLITESADKQRENELAQAKIEAQSLADSKKAATDISNSYIIFHNPYECQ